MKMTKRDSIAVLDDHGGRANIAKFERKIFAKLFPWLCKVCSSYSNKCYCQQKHSTNQGKLIKGIVNCSGFSNNFSLFQHEKKTHCYKNFSPCVVSIQKKYFGKNHIGKKLQFGTILFPYKKCVKWEEKICKPRV